MFDTINIIQTAGLVGIFLIIFAETGLFFAFFFPGDSLLFAAGLFVHSGFLPIIPLIIGTSIAAIIGGFVGYMIGHRLGPKVFTKENSFFFRKKYLEDSEKYFKKYGNKTIVIARFIPVVRTFAPILAGVGRMNFRDFTIFNIISGMIWPPIMISIGYFLGFRIPNIQDYFLHITFTIIILSCLPLLPNLVSILRKKRFHIFR